MNKIYLFIIVSFCLANTGYAQTNTEFWFAAPEVISSHADRPIYLRISTAELPSTITIDIPANPGFKAISASVTANSTKAIDLTPFIDLFENEPADKVLNKGMHITSTSKVTVYYEVLGTDPEKGILNSDIFILKGQTALGLKFYTPFQTFLKNAPGENAWSSFDIVATEDNTTVWITPTKDIIGHAALSKFRITLNKGQTYSARAKESTAAAHPAGSLVESDKPVAVTIKDDSVIHYWGWDLIGDQIVPVDATGSNYIVSRGFVTHIPSYDDDGDRIILCATEDNTEISVSGLHTKTLRKAGDVFNHQLILPTEYIEATKPVYAFHVSGFGNELGGALLPPILYTGSKQISFTRASDDPFYLNILVRAGGEGDFVLNGSKNIITAYNFNTVPGTPQPGEWKSASILMNTSIISTGSNNIISNSSKDFHLGLINGTTEGSGCRYGYFSDFKPINLNFVRDINTLEDISGKITFIEGMATLNAGSVEVLKDVVKLMKDNTVYNLKVEGHAYNGDNAAGNLKLSQDRANAVKTFLISKGLNAGRVIAVGYGSTKPIVENNDQAEKASNQKIELKLF